MAEQRELDKLNRVSYLLHCYIFIFPFYLTKVECCGAVVGGDAFVGVSICKQVGFHIKTKICSSKQIRSIFLALIFSTR